MIDSFTIGKLVGLLEGEGSFGTNHGSPCIQLGMSDRDVVTWAAQQFGSNVMGPYDCSGVGGTKPHYRTCAWGATAVGWMMTMYTAMGLRRRARIRQVLAEWRAKPLTGTYRYHAGDRIIPACHPERRHYAHSQCRSCYRKERLN